MVREEVCGVSTLFDRTIKDAETSAGIVCRLSRIVHREIAHGDTARAQEVFVELAAEWGWLDTTTEKLLVLVKEARSCHDDALFRIKDAKS